MTAGCIAGAFTGLCAPASAEPAWETVKNTVKIVKISVKIVEKIKGYTHKRREFRILCGSRNLGRNKSVAIPKKSI